MTEAELRAALKGDITGAYLLWGDEDYLKRFYMGQIKAAVLKDCPPGLEAFNTLEFTLEDGDFSPLQTAIATPPLMAEKKYIGAMAPAAASWKEKERKALAAVLCELSSVPDTVFVLLCPRDTLDPGSKRKPDPTFKLLTTYLTPVELPFQTGAKLSRWVKRHFDEAGVSAEDAVLSSILNRCAPDMLSLKGEIDKLLSYVKATGRDTVTEKDVLFVTSHTPKEEDFGLSNAILAGDRRAALTALDSMKKHKEDPVLILASLARVMSDLVTVGELCAEGAERAEIAKLLVFHEYKAGLYMQSARDIGLPRLKAALRRCLAANRTAKTLDLDYIPLERFLATIPQRKTGGVRRG